MVLNLTVGEIVGDLCGYFVRGRVGRFVGFPLGYSVGLPVEFLLVGLPIKYTTFVSQFFCNCFVFMKYVLPVGDSVL